MMKLASYKLSIYISSLPSPVKVQADLVFQEQNQGSLKISCLYTVNQKTWSAMAINWGRESWIYDPECTCNSSSSQIVFAKLWHLLVFIVFSYLLYWLCLDNFVFLKKYTNIVGRNMIGPWKKQISAVNSTISKVIINRSIFVIF